MPPQKQTHAEGQPCADGTCEKPDDDRGRGQGNRPTKQPQDGWHPPGAGSEWQGRVLAHRLQREHNPVDTLTLALALALASRAVRISCLQSLSVWCCVVAAPGSDTGGNTAHTRLVVVVVLDF